jgi:two-component system chemotaxis response regulator CheB
MKNRNIVVMCASAGGPRILKKIFSGLPRLDCFILLVQHMPKFVNKSFTDHLNGWTEMDAKLASYGDCVEHGKILVAPTELHVELIDNYKIRLYEGEKKNFVCPSVDVTMLSLKRMPGIQFFGIILTGMGKDGAEGIQYLKQLDGITIAQEEKSCIIYGMAKEAIDTGSVDLILTPEEIRTKLIEWVGIIE